LRVHFSISFRKVVAAFATPRYNLCPRVITKSGHRPSLPQGSRLSRLGRRKKKQSARGRCAFRCFECEATLQMVVSLENSKESPKARGSAEKGRLRSGVFVHRAPRHHGKIGGLGSGLPKCSSTARCTAVRDSRAQNSFAAPHSRIDGGETEAVSNPHVPRRRSGGPSS